MAQQTSDWNSPMLAFERWCVAPVAESPWADDSVDDDPYDRMGG
jgi:hypothetical protein